MDALLTETAAEEKKLAMAIDSMATEIDQLRAETHLKLSELNRLEGRIEYMKSDFEHQSAAKLQLQTLLLRLGREIEQYCGIMVEESESWHRRTRLGRL